VNTVINLRVPQNAGNFVNSCKTSAFSRGAQPHEVSWLLMVEWRVKRMLNELVVANFEHHSSNWLERLRKATKHLTYLNRSVGRG
jgi:hypothetical protein